MSPQSNPWIGSAAAADSRDGHFGLAVVHDLSEPAAFGWNRRCERSLGEDSPAGRVAGVFFGHG
jgi:hypothetical protein